MDAKISLGNNLEAGLPFSKTYFKPTPKLFRKIGDGILSAAAVAGLVGTIVSFPPSVIAIIGCAGVVGKYLTNCLGEKE